MSVCVYSVCVVLRVGRGLATGWSPVQGVLPTVYRSRNWKILTLNSTICNGSNCIISRVCYCTHVIMTVVVYFYRRRSNRVVLVLCHTSCAWGSWIYETYINIHTSSPVKMFL
jgi:hypothetical protein